jgi:hypothetical protein
MPSCPVPGVVHARGGPVPDVEHARGGPVTRATAATAASAGQLAEVSLRGESP